jgi:hypothetical protein
VVTGSQAPAIPEPLPGKIRLNAPNDNKQYIYRELPPKVSFNWAGDESAHSYRLSLARDADFDDAVFTGEVKNTHFEHGNLKQGHYFWRVVGLNKNGGEGPASEVLRIKLEQDLDPPRLDMDFPVTEIGQKRYLLKGKAEAGSKVFIGGAEVSVDEGGAFIHEFELKAGVNIVVVEVVDIAGNITYKSETVHGKF